jgi:hypothetical protein
MSEVVTAADINRKHIQLMRALDNGQTEVAEADEKFVRAKERLAKKGVRVRQEARAKAREAGYRLTVGELDDLTFEQTADERWDMEMAQQALRDIKERQRVLHSQVQSVQSMGANLRAEMRLSGVS